MLQKHLVDVNSSQSSNGKTLSANQLKKYPCRTQCSICGFSFTSKYFKKHVIGVHNIPIEDVQKYKVAHSNPVHCKKELIEKGRTMESGGKLMFNCVECSLQWSDMHSYRAHLRSHDGETPVICDKCSKLFRTRDNLRTHIRIVHEGVKKHVCEYCEKRFSCNSNLESHRRLHTGEKPYVCQHCGKPYRNYTTFSIHLMYHEGIRKYACTLCSKKYFRQVHLTKHVKTTHMKEKPHNFSCNGCCKTFVTKAGLKKHVLSNSCTENAIVQSNVE
uniref:Zinc finger protein 473 n=1 Tax=Cacopsylla melanoneura TaxID=428564 RepID=A0A8D9B6P9_9HEMI